MPEIEFHPDISQEIRDGYNWYESRSTGLGEDFINELDSAFDLILELPDTWPVLSKGFRRYLLDRFPYGVIYKIRRESIFIVAVMHLSREPGYWVHRVE
ncbi:MAG: type II toxin-antitoxin system RelE/ParE family toxin [Proteobacteria bacterium]|nr:type II toxin-antitoxin system RelE/ParE family toxin [Pseudomonadota bacterium]